MPVAPCGSARLGSCASRPGGGRVVGAAIPRHHQAPGACSGREGGVAPGDTAVPPCPQAGGAGRQLR
eukprot:4883078-Lingulodinium_polyedra.AAC.1